MYARSVHRDNSVQTCARIRAVVFHVITGRFMAKGPDVLVAVG